MEKKKTTPLLSLLNDRRAWERPARKPEFSEAQIRRINELAAEAARANPSDPFAGPRKRLHLMRGIDDIGGG